MVILKPDLQSAGTSGCSFGGLMQQSAMLELYLATGVIST